MNNCYLLEEEVFLHKHNNDYNPCINSSLIPLDEEVMENNNNQDSASFFAILKSKYDQFSIVKVFQTKSFLLFVYCFLLLISSVGNSIYQKRMTNVMPNYSYFLSQFTTVVYLPIFAPIVLYEMKFTEYITDEQLGFPKYKFFIMGMLDSISALFAFLGGVYTSGSSQTLLYQLVVPVTMILAYFFLKTKFKFLQLFGAFVILLGAFVVVLPKFLFSTVDNSSAIIPDKPVFNIIYLLSVFPMAFSTIYKEIAFKDVELDVNYVQFWVALWQFLFGFLMIPLNTLPFLGSIRLTWDELPYNLWNGVKCLGGYNTIVTNCGSGSMGFKMPCDTCDSAYVEVVVFIIFNCIYNVSIMLMIKHGSAALLYIILTLRLPIVNIAFSFSFVENPPEPLDWYYF